MQLPIQDGDADVDVAEQLPQEPCSLLVHDALTGASSPQSSAAVDGQRRNRYPRGRPPTGGDGEGPSTNITGTSGASR